MIQDNGISIQNIYYMLAYAFQSLNSSAREDINTESFENIHNLFAAILSKAIGVQLKRGLYREYRHHQDDLTTMRGKIDVPRTIKNKLSRKQIISCEYDELSENNLLNQILKTAVILLLRHGSVDPKYKNEIKKSMLFFDDVEVLDPSSIKWSSVRFQRNNQSYRMIIGICQLIMTGMLMTTDSGAYRLETFIDDQRMCRLYEKFILEYYTKEFPLLNVSASRIPWGLDDRMKELLPAMQSDVTLQKGNAVLIIDAKYYGCITQMHYDKRTLHSHNLYQIFTYVKNKDFELGSIAHQVSGLLLYAQTEKEALLNHTYKMSGNKISVRTLDLNCEFAEIAKQLNLIVEEHFGEKQSVN